MILQDVKNKKVSDLMSRNILVGHQSNSFTHTLRLFSEMTFHHLPIVNSDQELVGIISSNDMLKSLTLKLPMLKNTKDDTLNQALDIKELMTPNPVVISPQSNIEEVLNAFSHYHIHALPVVENNKIVGIITSNDVLAELNNKNK